jgi:hypothetical protein
MAFAHSVAGSAIWLKNFSPLSLLASSNSSRLLPTETSRKMKPSPAKASQFNQLRFSEPFLAFAWPMGFSLV